ncbi:zinc-regulated TonB-dependent outer membrane receptor [Lujinxingia litoralis]|uniref:Zinc-regulated TonB-dependent outer membrane receptor n=1 Tax=Lujinxingia litoralis TaxID=2211119 RepID=A0A328CD98_9DELT|nr:zinc-regulated TonB-dependent outer membrane receptor [Lujinxingia litoralis]RAL25331.1 zinc-regulated TonB-dependent outer membrane receptor [Lujinxingia litoralis]
MLTLPHNFAPSALRPALSLVGMLVLCAGLTYPLSTAAQPSPPLAPLPRDAQAPPSPPGSSLAASDDGDVDTTDDIEAELEALEAELNTTEPRPSSAEPRPSAPPNPTGALPSLNPDISLIADFALAWFSDDPELMGGHDASKMGFNLQGLELGLSAGIDPYWRFDSHILISLFGLEVEEAYATTLALPANLQVRAGQFLTRFGRVNPTHLHAWNFTTQPLVLGKFFGGEGLRGLGVEVGQLLPLPWMASWTLSAQSIAGAATGRSFLASAEDLEQLQDLTVSARLEQFWDLSAHSGLLLGLSAANGPNSSGRGNRSDIFGVDLLLKRTVTGPRGRSELGWQSEWMLRRRQDPGPPDQEGGSVLQDWGGYTELYYSPSLTWRAAARLEHVSGRADDPLDPQWINARQRGALSLSYTPSHFSRLRLEYGINHLPDAVQPRVHMVFLQLDLVAGAHGAHRY